MTAAPHPTAPTHGLAAQYFDGRSARAHEALVQVQAGELVIRPAGEASFDTLHVALAAVRWSERQRHGSRHADLPNGARLHASDALAWDRWRRSLGAGDSLVVRSQQSWRGVVVASLLLIGASVSAYLWGLPAAARVTVAVLPQTVDAQVGDQLLTALEDEVFAPSLLPESTQRRWLSRFREAAQATHAPQPPPPHRVLFRHSPKLGANALALPGGTIVVTDQMVQAFEQDADHGEPVLVGMFGHELGHVAHRHGMRTVVQASLLAVAVAMAIGDVSGVTSALTVTALQMGYSRDAEREADDEAIRTLLAEGQDPAQMRRLFTALGEDTSRRPVTLLGIALSSHPDDAERVRRFEQAGRLK
ncbi:M48 family metallopeptidase [Aquincola tertiaricarbonis]|uniref:M48 family metallopeptidase n=1 Tax=Aquincola tertiaricarbonis TaxID=391953 RepID=A0ABY4SBN5_AQUTE|nr:M48 family metallopeptidase [Aquincola tertiaricarbonis]URI10414.1 M48 family metallopeptidase [Aquincola tertiaricarbonis]